MPDPTVKAPAPFLAYWRCLSGYAGGRLWLSVALLVATAALEASGLLMLLPLLQSIGVESAAPGRGLAGSAFHALNRLGVPIALPAILAIFVSIKAAQSGLRTYSGFLNLKLENEFTCFLRERFYRAMMRAHWLFLTRRRSSDITQALIDELPRVGFGTQQFLSLLSLVAIATAHVVIAFMLSPSMTVLALTAGAVVALGLRRFRQRAFQLGRRGQATRAEMTAAISEHLAAMKIAKSHGRESHHFDHFQSAMHAIVAHTLRMFRVNAVIRVWIELGAVIALAIFVFFAVEVQRIETAQLLVLAFAFSRLLSHVNALQNAWQGVARTLPSFVTTEQMRAEFVAAAEPAPATAVQRVALRDAIQLDSASFSYDPAQPAVALSRTDLVIPARRVTAICGPSGAGKSTLADLLLGLLSPTSGRVLLDGKELAGPLLHDWRQSVGYVPQETFLFHDTVRANLLWSRADATEGDLRAALRAAAAEEFVDRLPQGLDTILGDRGVRLSGGERQRLALARALLRRPTLLVLDEATSALDTRNEQLIQEAIERLQGELTIVLIAHRLSTVRMADRIVVMENGAIAETGTWDELCAREGGLFRQLAAADRSA